jgi:hypothetical protein
MSAVRPSLNTGLSSSLSRDGGQKRNKSNSEVSLQTRGGSFTFGNVKTILSLSALAITLAASMSSNAEIAIDSMGFIAARGVSSDDIYVLSGSFIVMPGALMAVDNIEITGNLVTVFPNMLIQPEGDGHEGELVVNGGFENFEETFLSDASGGMSITPGSVAIPGWTTITEDLAWLSDGNLYGMRSADGSFFLDLTGYHDAPPYGGISQPLTTLIGQTYKLSFVVGSHENDSIYQGPMEVAVNLGSFTKSFLFEPSGEGSQWGTFAWDFTADSATTLLSFQGASSGGGAYLGLDNISVVPVVDVTRAAIISVGGNQLIARFPVEPGRFYSIESIEDLATGEWQIVPETTREIVGSTFEVVLPYSAVESQRFYRIRQLP